MNGFPNAQKSGGVPRRVRLGGGLLLAWLSMGCGLAPWISVRSHAPTPAEWDDIERRVLRLSPDRPGRVLHVLVWSQEDRLFVRVDIPLWMVRLPVGGGRTLVRWLPPDECDETCQAVLTSRAWDAFFVRGTSVWVSTPTERVAIWVE